MVKKGLKDISLHLFSSGRSCHENVTLFSFAEMFSPVYPRTSWYIRTVSPLDTVRKDDAGRNSIYQRLVNRLAHVPGDDQGCSRGWRGEILGREREKERGRNGHRGRDVDDRKTKIRNSNLSREQLISRTSPPSLVSATTSPALGWRTTPPLPLHPEVAAQTTLSSASATPHTDAARLTFLRPEIPTVIGRQTVVFNRSNRMAELEQRLSRKASRPFPSLDRSRHSRMCSPSDCVLPGCSYPSWQKYIVFKLYDRCCIDKYFLILSQLIRR